MLSGTTKKMTRPLQNLILEKKKLPFENNSVDNIYISHVIEHIENEHIQNLFIECFRVLKERVYS